MIEMYSLPRIYYSSRVVQKDRKLYESYGVEKRRLVM